MTPLESILSKRALLFSNTALDTEKIQVVQVEVSSQMSGPWTLDPGPPYLTSRIVIFFRGLDCRRLSCILRVQNLKQGFNSSLYCVSWITTCHRQCKNQRDHNFTPILCFITHLRNLLSTTQVSVTFAQPYQVLEGAYLYHHIIVPFSN